MTVPAEVRREVEEGMSRPQKALPPKFFYDRRGSELFEEITALSEYYPTRTEHALLERWASGWVEYVGSRTLVELGAGSAAKTRNILDAMTGAGTAEVYAPVDISEDFLAETARTLRVEYPDLRVVPVVADISTALDLPPSLPRPAIFAFLGSTIGNFEAEAAAALVRRIGAAMRPGDRFLLGVDLRKEPAVLEAAYNDSRGVTAEFNLNMLRVLNAELGANFDPRAFRHRAFYDRERHRIEMHLVAIRPQRVTIPGSGSWEIAEGESIRTEISCKHDRDSVQALLDAAGLSMERWETDPDGLYAITLASR
jgi:L-histidine N-alpha-methyltransferase